MPCQCNKFTFEEKPDVFQMFQGGGGAVKSVNGKTGVVVLTAEDVGALPDTYEAPVTSVNEKTGAVVLDAGDIGYDGETTYPDASVGAELGTINSALSSLSSVTEIIDTASGAIASFPDGAGLPMRSLVAEINPVQDLHGYDAPWSGGAGKNLLPMTLANMKTINYAGTWNENVYTLAGVTFTINTDDGGNVISITTNGTSTGTALLRLCNEITFAEETTLNGSPSAGGYSSFKLEADKVGGGVYQDIGNGINMPANTELTRIIILAPNGTVLNNTVFYPMVRLKSDSDATFAPYSNECPISGWTGLSGKRTGFNVWDEEWEVGGINTSGEPATATNRIRSKNFVTVTPNESYFFKSPTGVYLWAYDINKAYIGRLNNGNLATGSITIPSNCHYVKFVPDYPSYGTTYNNDISINYPSTDTAYHAYTGEAISVSFPTTVYGGTDEVVGGNGISTMGNIVYDGSDDEDIRIYSGQRFTLGCPDYVSPASSVVDNIISNEFKTVSKSGQGTGLYLISGSDNGQRQFMINVGLSTVADVKAWLSANPLQVCYPLATPTTFTHSPQEVDTLVGQNNIWVDTGDVTVTYQASIKGYIDKVLGT